MEGNATIEDAKQLFGNNFIGPKELAFISDDIGIVNPLHYYKVLPKIPFSLEFLKEKKDNYILLLGIPDFHDSTSLTLNKLRSFFGIDPLNEPCFYNQDWYLNEPFFNTCSIELKWYLIRTDLYESSKGLSSQFVSDEITNSLPSALLCAFAFFSTYLMFNRVLWSVDYVWCSDFDLNGDQIYVGRYCDPARMVKNGFSIHRHLSIRKNYGCIDFY